MAAVGAFQWRGSYQEVSTEGQREDFKELRDMDPDSYLGQEVQNELHIKLLYCVPVHSDHHQV